MDSYGRAWRTGERACGRLECRTVGKLLVVDDEAHYRTEIAAILASRGHEVRTASEGRDALQVGRVFAPDVLIADWRLATEVNGLELAGMLREHLPRLGVVMITGYSAQDLRAENTLADVRVLEKPFGLRDLLASVGSALSDSVRGT